MPNIVTTPIDFTQQANFTAVANTVSFSTSGVTETGSAGSYATNNPKVSMNSSLGMSVISGFAETATYTAPDALQYILNIAGSDYYWNGAAWASSDGTYTKSNTATDINTNCGHASMTSLLGTGVNVLVKAFLHSNTGATAPILKTVSITYTFASVKPTAPALCVVFLWLKDILGADITNTQSAQFSVKNNHSFKNGSYIVVPFVKSSSFDSSGYAQLVLEETQTPGVFLNFSVSYQQGKTTKQINFIPCVVPNYGSVPLTSITTEGTTSGSGLTTAVTSATPANSFTTIVPTTGTNPVATNTTDTLSLTSADASMVITGTGNTRTLDFRVNYWTKYTVTYAQLSAATLSNYVTIFTLSAKAVINNVVVKHSVAFSGGAISAYVVSVGIVGTPAKYSTNFNVFQAVASNTFKISTANNMEDFTSGTAIIVTGTSTTANLSAATAGSVDVWVQTSLLP